MDNIFELFEKSSHNINRTEYKPNSNPPTLPESAYDDRGVSGLRAKGKDYNDTSKIFSPSATLLTQRIAEDVSRISKWIKDNPAWLLKQQGLYMMNPKQDNIDNRIFNPVKLMTNLGSRLTGFHKESHGILTDGRNISLESNIMRLYKELKIGDISDRRVEQSISEILLNKLSTNAIFPINNKRLNAISGTHGPDSKYGVGSTDFYIYRSGLNPSFNYVDKVGRINYYPNYSVKYDYATVTNDKIKNEEEDTLQRTTNQLYVDQSQIPGFKQSTNTIDPDFNNYKNLSTWAKDTDKNKTHILDSYNKTQRDEINNVYTIEPVKNFYVRLGMADTGVGNMDIAYHSAEYEDENKNKRDKFKDFITLKIGTIQFRCTIEGFSDSFSPEWSPTKYIGRPDNVYVYTGMSRKIGFTFTVYANSRNEMGVMYEKLNRLIGLVSPSFGDNNIMRGQVTELKLGQWIARNREEGLPVIIESLSYTIDTDTPWDIDIDYELPMLIKVQVDFNVLSDSIPEAGKIYIGKTQKPKTN